MLWLALVFLNSLPALAAEPVVKCGGNYNGEELTFRVNPLNGILSAATATDEFLAYVDLHRPASPHILYGEVVKDAEWDKLKAIRDASADEDLKTLISRLGSMKMTEIWVGWSEEGYIHLDIQQRDRKFSLSCQKL